MKFIQLTRPDGKVMYVGRNIIVEEILSGESATRAKSCVTVNGHTRYVIEDVDTVLRKFAAKI